MREAFGANPLASVRSADSAISISSFRSQSELDELLDSWDATAAEECRVSDASARSLQCFIKGYARSTKGHQHQKVCDLGVVGEVRLDGPSPWSRDVADHYQFFSKINVDEGGIKSKVEHNRRLEHVQSQLLRDRIIMNSRRVVACHGAQTARSQRRDSARQSVSDSPKAQPFSPRLQKLRSEAQGESKLISREEAKKSQKGKKKNRFLQSLSEEDHARVNLHSAAATAAMKAEMRTREACESLRFLVFSTTGQQFRSTGGGAFYEQRIGTQDEVAQLHAVWTQMDEDGSGDIEFEEFLSYFSKTRGDRLLGMRCVKYLVGNLKDTDEGETAGCRIEDMMKLIWLKAGPDDIAKMMTWFRQAEFDTDRTPTPPLLPKRKRRQILENFPMLDNGQVITFGDLVDSGLCDYTTAEDLRRHYDRDDSNKITESLLLEMLCPNGFRAHKDVTHCIDGEGEPLVLVSNDCYHGWVDSSKIAKWANEDDADDDMKGK